MSIKVKHYDNGQIKWLEIRDENGSLHNPDGPARQEWYANGQEERRAYYLNNVLHNPDGAAFRRWRLDGGELYRAYWLNGERFTEAEFNEQKDTVLVTCNGKEVHISRKSAEAMNLI